MLPAPSDPLTGRDGKTKCGTKNEQMKELAATLILMDFS